MGLPVQCPPSNHVQVWIYFIQCGMDNFSQFLALIWAQASWVQKVETKIGDTFPLLSSKLTCKKGKKTTFKWLEDIRIIGTKKQNGQFFKLGLKGMSWWYHHTFLRLTWKSNRHKEHCPQGRLLSVRQSLMYCERKEIEIAHIALTRERERERKRERECESYLH